VAGSLKQQPNGTWLLRVYVGRDESGRVKHRSRTFRGTRREAERELARVVTQEADSPSGLEENDRRPPRWGVTTTVNDAIAGWKLNGWDNLSPTTRRRYEVLWRLHVKESIGRRRLVDLTPWDLERYFRQLKTSSQSQASVRYARAMLHRACRLARKWSNGVLPNPVADTELPEWRFDEQAEPVRAPSAEEVRTILGAAEARDRRLWVFIRVTAASGARRGEVCGIRWSDIDWETGSIRFDEAVIAAPGGGVVKQPKTRASVRRVAVDAGTLRALGSLQADNAQLAEACATALDPNGFAFSVEPNGKAVPHPDAFSRGFRRLCNRVGVASDVHLHSLRHFQSTELDSVVTEAQKQARMGWSTIQMARHYTDAVSSEDRRTADHIGVLLDQAIEVTRVVDRSAN
jgi:integrase